MKKTNMEYDIGNTKCRIFIQDIKQQAWQLFSLEQNKRDGSIYLGSPEFTSFEWLTLEIKNNKLVSLKIQQDKEGHLSFHGSGRVQVKSKNEKYRMSIAGQYLLKPTEKNISLRHIFTIFPKKPNYIPNSKALNRKSDQVIQSTQQLKPFVCVAFALPRVELEINFNMSFQIEDLDDIPNNLLGMSTFPLVYHDILLFFYRTKSMDEWPKRTMLQYWDGINVPIFIGKPGKLLYVEFRSVVFNLKDKKLQIKL